MHNAYFVKNNARAAASRVLGLALATFCLMPWTAFAQQEAQKAVVPGVTVTANSIGGVVVNANGAKPEAGVWVIAENKSLSVPYRKIVVTDDQGRFMVPELPAGNYELWVRGYGLKDSDRVKAALRGSFKLQVQNASSPQEAAKIYPAGYWTSLIHPPAKDKLPAKFVSQEHWLADFRSGCNQCHQTGMQNMRNFTEAKTWEAFIKLNPGMQRNAEGLGMQVLTEALADWGKRIKAGEVPVAPSRPTGMERNYVVTEWDWGAKESFIHDVVSTDKRNATLYANGKVYGADRTGGGRLWALDPVKNTVEGIQVVPRDAKGFSTKLDYYHALDAAEFGGDSEKQWMASPHNPMFDEKGRVWLTVPVRPPGPENNPKWTPEAVATPTNDPKELDEAAKLLMSRNHSMQLGYYDTKTGKFVGVDTPYNTHHLQLDWQGRVWSDGDVLGMLDANKIDPKNPQATEGTAEKAWMRFDPATGKIMSTGGYTVAISPITGDVWLPISQSNGVNNRVWKLDPKTRQMTDYPLPLPGRFSHGLDFSTDGNAWFSAGSGHLGKIDAKTGKFTYWELPGVKFPGTGPETGSTEYPYLLWVDQFDTLGLGKDLVIVTGTTTDSMLIFDPKTEKWQVLRIPYPMPFFTRGLDGRIDNPKTGWKGRGLWTTYASYMPKFTETKIGSVEHIQLRPNPLAN
ncbi:MAG: hypothetical protein ABL995_07495 [Bryobacteraceae bacterium]